MTIAHSVQSRLRKLYFAVHGSTDTQSYMFVFACYFLHVDKENGLVLFIGSFMHPELRKHLAVLSLDILSYSYKTIEHI